MSCCKIFPSCMCPTTYKNCDLNFMNFWAILCFYYESVKGGLPVVLANLPLLILLAPTLPVVGFLYIIYLISFPIGSVLNYFAPALAPIVISFVTIFLVGASRIRTISWFLK